MICDKKFVFTGLQSWNMSASGNERKLAMEISRHNQVLYVNPPMDMAGLLRGYRDREEKPDSTVRVRYDSQRVLRRVNPGLWVLEPPVILSAVHGVKNFTVFDFFNKRNNLKFYGALSWALEHLGFERIIHINDNDLFRSFYLKELLGPQLSIYYRRDDLTVNSFWAHHARRIEPELIAKSDIVLTTNDTLAEDARDYNFNVFNVGQGVDLEHFDPTVEQPMPCFLRNLPRPIVGYAGPLDTASLAPNLIYRLASERPRYSVVLLGREDHIFKRHSLHDLPNVHFIRSRHVQDFPAYIRHFDVCIYPQVIHDVTREDYPRRIDEFLAMGKPVVTMRTPLTEIFYRQAYLAETERSFLQLVDYALTETDDNRLRRSRMAFARTHTWEQCVDRIYSVIEMIMNENDPEEIWNVYDKSVPCS